MKQKLQDSSDIPTAITVTGTPGYIIQALPIASQYFNDSNEIMSFEHIIVGPHDVKNFDVTVRDDKLTIVLSESNLAWQMFRVAELFAKAQKIDYRYLANLASTFKEYDSYEEEVLKNLTDEYAEYLQRRNERWCVGFIDSTVKCLGLERLDDGTRNAIKELALPTVEWKVIPELTDEDKKYACIDLAWRCYGFGRPFPEVLADYVMNDGGDHLNAFRKLVIATKEGTVQAKSEAVNALKKAMLGDIGHLGNTGCRSGGYIA